MKIKKLSIVIPVYNEKDTIKEILKRVEKASIGRIRKEIIIVDDGSTDGTGGILKKLAKSGKVKFLYHKRNQGKGAALRTGFSQVTGDVIVTQDADLEYDPNDLVKLIKVMEKKNAQVVYGSRLLNKKKIKHGGWMFYYGGLFINFFTNLLYEANITDEATGYKMFRADLLRSLNLDCNGFEFCPEVTAKIAKKGIKIHEVGISYSGRTVDEGKKIRWRDGAKAMWVLLKYKFVD